MATALEYVHALAEETGEFGSFTTTSIGTSTTLVCSRLANTALAATEFANMTVLIESGEEAGEVGHVKGGGLDRSTGTLTVADAFTGAIGSGVTFSLYRLLAPLDGDNVKPSYLQAVNLALQRLWVERTISFTGVSGQHYYTVDTTTHPWFVDDSRIMWVQAPVSSADEQPRRLPASAWEWDADGETKRLYFYSPPATTGQTFTVKVYAPGNSRLKINGSWANQTTQTAGLVDIDDEALPAVADVRAVGKAVLYDLLSNLDQPAANVVAWLTKHGGKIPAAKSRQAFGVPKDRTTGIITLRPSVLGGRRR